MRIVNALYSVRNVNQSPMKLDKCIRNSFPFANFLCFALFFQSIIQYAFIVCGCRRVTSKGQHTGRCTVIVVFVQLLCCFTRCCLSLHMGRRTVLVVSVELLSCFA
eukprot:g28564.t1